MPLSPRNHGMPPPVIATETQQPVLFRCSPITFVRWGDIAKDNPFEQDINACLYRDTPETVQPPLPLANYNNGYTMIQRFGYDGTTELGARQQGIYELPIPPTQRNTRGLGYGQQSTSPVVQDIQVNHEKIA